MADDQLVYALSVLNQSVEEIKIPESMAAVYVALEAFTNYVEKTKEEELKPWAANEESRILELIDEFKAKVAETRFSDDAARTAEVRQILSSRINSLRRPTNNDKLKKPFGLYGLNLTRAEKKLLEKRNFYLHGATAIPASPEDEDFNSLVTQNDIQLYYDLRHVHRIISLLFLKIAGYSGKVSLYDEVFKMTPEERTMDSCWQFFVDI